MEAKSRLRLWSATVVALLAGCAVGPRPPDATIQYLGHSGWRIETSAHVLIFDHVPPSGLDPATARRAVGLTGSEDREVVVFITHHHADHFDEGVLAWEEVDRFVLGWAEAPAASGHLIVPPDRSVPLDGLRVHAIPSTDAGAAFVVEVDDLVILHAGDLARWTEGDAEAFRGAIERVPGLVERVDVAFFPIATGLRCEPRESIWEGAIDALGFLRPAAAFPMHVRCEDRFDLYSRFAERAERETSVAVHAPGAPGDTFVYRLGVVEPTTPPGPTP